MEMTNATEDQKRSLIEEHTAIVLQRIKQKHDQKIQSLVLWKRRENEEVNRPKEIEFKGLGNLNKTL